MHNGKKRFFNILKGNNGILKEIHSKEGYSKIEMVNKNKNG